MYDFLFSEEFWKETIIAAAITSVATLIVAALYYNFKIKVIFDNSKDILKEQKDLSSGISREHRDRFGEHGEILKQVALVNSDVKRAEAGVQSIIKDLTETKTDQRHSYERLNEKQKDIVNSIDNIKAMAGEMKRLVGENAELRQELHSEREKNMDLREQINKRPRDRGMQR